MTPETVTIASSVERPDIFHYIDFRKYLKDIFSYYKKVYPYFSYRYISKKVMAGSAGWFPNITAGRNTLTGTYLYRTGKLFDLDGRALEYFDLITRYGQTSSIEEKGYYLSRIHEMKGVDFRLLGKEQFDYYRCWYISAIRELLLIIDDEGDEERIASLLRPQISRMEAIGAINTLVKLDLVRRNVHGKLKPTDEIVRKDPEFSSMYWATNMHAKISLALGALETVHKEERDFSEVVVPLSAEGMAEVSGELALLRKKILAISRNDKGRNRIYQCSLQLFPITQCTGETAQ